MNAAYGFLASLALSLSLGCGVVPNPLIGGGEGEGLELVSLDTIVMNAEAASLFDLISPGDYVPTDEGRATWLSLMEGSTLQEDCNREGFNVSGGGGGGDYHRVRIGIIGSNNGDCHASASRLGIGGSGSKCGTNEDPNGNFAGCLDGEQNTTAFGAVFVR